MISYVEGRHVTVSELKKALRDCEIVTMPGLGHYPDVEDPPGFLAIADRFLSRKSS